jgi:hypothetical protein
MRHGIYIKLDSAVLEHFRAAGPGYQARINSALRAAIGSKHDESSERAMRRAVAYAQVAFDKYFARAFWHFRKEAVVTEALIPEVIAGLKRYGGREGFKEADLICRLMNSRS